jgi:uncharacterized protein (TIGR02594 family)
MRTLKLNDRGQDVRAVQLLLNARVLPPPHLRPDGHFGARTQQAVINFQRAQKLVADGQVGPQTQAALGLRAGANLSAAPTGGGLPWMDVAVAELGVHENSLPGQHNARIVAYHQTTTLRATDDETPWCSSFVNWVMKQSGRTGTGSAAAKSWLNWGVATTTPTLGTVVVIKKKTPGLTQATGSATGYHVAFFVSQSPTHIRLLGGNQSDQVRYSNFALASYEVQGYRNPN